MRNFSIIFMFCLILLLNSNISVFAQTVLPPKYWNYELKPYYSRIIPVNSTYFVIEKQLSSSGMFSKIQYIYNEKKNKYIPLNKKFSDLKCLNENGVGFYAQYVESAEKKLYGFINFEKKISHPCKYSNFQPFAKGTAIVQDFKTEKYYIVDENGNTVKGPFSEYITNLDEENLRLKRIKVIDNAYHSHYEYIFTDSLGGNLFNSKKFLSAHPFFNGYAMVGTDGGRCGYINRKGQQVVPYTFTNCSNFSNGSALIYNPKTKETLILDKNLKTHVVKEEYGQFTEQFLQKHDPNGLVLYSKYTNHYKDIKLPKHYKTIYARKNNGQIIIPPGLYYEGEHVYKNYYIFKKYELRKDEYGAFLVQSNNPVLINSNGTVYDTYEKTKILNIPHQYLVETKNNQLMLLDKNISGEHEFPWVNFKNKKGSKGDNLIQIMEYGRYGIIKLN